MLPTFKELIAEDSGRVFMNELEFADIHEVGGKRIRALVDNNEHIDREKRYQWSKAQYGDGLFLTQKLIYVLAKEFGPLPLIDRDITFDGRHYNIADAINEDGIYSLTLEANKTGR